MKEKRKHKRFKVDAMNIQGKMVLARKVDITDISADGVALKADRRLDMGREYSIQLTYGGKSISVTGVVVRSSLSGTETIGGAAPVPIYSAGLRFTEKSRDKIAIFLKEINLDTKEEVPVRNDRRRSVRFHIITQGDAVMSFPIHYTVRKISLSGMLIRTQQSLEIESIVPMELSIHEKENSAFKGRVASCRNIDDAAGTHYEIEVEFLQLGDEGRKVLKSFIDYLAATEGKASGNPSGRENR